MPFVVRAALTHGMLLLAPHPAGPVNPKRRCDMEFAIYLVISGLCGLAIFWSSVNAARKPGAPLKGPFRYLERVAPGTAKDGPDGSLPPRLPGEWRPER